jgi:hypothetical protein
MTITTTEILLLCGFGLAVAYALRVKEERDRLAYILRIVVEDESKYNYKTLRSEVATARKARDSKHV